MRRILLTGATGYLGSHLARSFLQEGCSICCVVLSFEKLGYLTDDKEKFLLLKSSDPFLREQIHQFAPEVMVHTACAYERGDNTIQMVFDANLSFPFHMLQFCLEAGTKRWINTNTVLESDVNSYALSKRQFVDWGRYYARKGEIEFLDLQLEHFYGPNAPEYHFLSWVIQCLQKNEPLPLTLGTQHRDFVYIRDLEKIFVKALELPFSGYEEIPIGTGIAPEIREVVAYLKEITGSKSELQFGAVPMRENEPESKENYSKMRKYGLSCPTGWMDGLKMALCEWRNSK